MAVLGPIVLPAPHLAPVQIPQLAHRCRELIAAAEWTLARELGAIAVKGRVEPCKIFQLDGGLTAEAAASHAALLAGLRAQDPAARNDLEACLRETPDDLAFSALAARAQAVGWSGIYRLDSK